MFLKKKIILIICSFLMCFTMFACGKKDASAPAITQTEKETELKNMLKKKQYTFDELKNVSFKDSETNEKDFTKLRQLFQNKVDFLKQDVNVTLSTNVSSTIADFSIIYAYYDDNWKAVIFYPINEKGWVSEAKDSIGKKRIMEDLKDIEFKGFKKGHIGKESLTKVILNKRDQKVDIGRDTLFTTVVTKTDFAKYKIGVDFVYQFEDNKWVLKEANIQDPTLWQIEYDKENLPKALTQEGVINKLTSDKNFLTYVTNPEYPTNTMLSETRENVGVDEISYMFDWMTEYEDIGKIKYKVRMPYKFSDGEWNEGKQKVSISNVNIEQMKGKWIGENDDEIIFEKTLKTKKTKYKDVIEGTYITKQTINADKVDPSTDPFDVDNNKKDKEQEDNNNEEEEKKKELKNRRTKELSINEEFEIKDRIDDLSDKVDKNSLRPSQFKEEVLKIKLDLPKGHKLEKDIEKIEKTFRLRLAVLNEKGLKKAIEEKKLIKNEEDLKAYIERSELDEKKDKEKIENLFKILKDINSEDEDLEDNSKEEKTKVIKAEYNIKMKLKVTKKDNDWAFKIIKFEPKNNSSLKFNIKEAKVDLEHKYIIIDGIKFSKKPFEEEPVEEPPKVEEPEAVGKNDGIKIDSMDVKVPAYVIENENYFKIRDLACALKDSKAKFKVDYDMEKKAIVIESKKDYEPLKTDMQPIKNIKSIGIRSYDKLIINGEETEVKAYKIEGFNYFRLRELGEILGFGVDYDFENNKVVITSEIKENSEEKDNEDKINQDDKDNKDEKNKKDNDKNNIDDLLKENEDDKIDPNDPLGEDN